MSFPCATSLDKRAVSCPRVLFRTVFLGLVGGCGRRSCCSSRIATSECFVLISPCVSRIFGGIVAWFSRWTHRTSFPDSRSHDQFLPASFRSGFPDASHRRSSAAVAGERLSPRSANAAYTLTAGEAGPGLRATPAEDPKFPSERESGEASVFDSSTSLPARSKARPRSLSFSGQSGPLHLHSARDPGARRHRIGLPRRCVLPSPSRRRGPEATSELLLGQRSEPLGPGAIQEERGP